MGDWFYVALGIALIAGVIGFALLLKEPSTTKQRRDPVAFSDAHLDARRQELAHFQGKAAKGFLKDRPGWRFEDPPRPKK